MPGVEFTLNDTCLTARPSGALWWAEAGLLCVSDLHLGKSERMARRGGALLPPFETRETLLRLEAEISELSPGTVVCLGDSFDDDVCAENLDEEDRAQIKGLMAGRRWFWIEGNHDRSNPGLGGTAVPELSRGPLTFRHIAEPRAVAGEVSGHYHPKTHVQTRAGGLSRPCFLHDAARLILPAFGTYTGGLSTSEEALRGLFGPQAFAILTGSTPCVIPLPDRKTA
ncbi:ligase-associated DNA damage response endonuclease PdeM [Halovulum sp. GXIMD14793]